MAKQQKTAKEIEALILTAASKLSECDGLTGVTIQVIDDKRAAFNWTVSATHNCTSTLCEIAIRAIVEKAQTLFDLKD